eukprot:TRINITY_DN6476_c0_g1_i1.p1 TRINITY_DN6476_c0_g1~~TRINITY_DN6476_c0_g1_i1.p1  ORF type:complete len:803 (-),score=172.67 TRINITY_DN6476_c0_g1_i1:227-2635(-)
MQGRPVVHATVGTSLGTPAPAAAAWCALPAAARPSQLRGAGRDAPCSSRQYVSSQPHSSSASSSSSSSSSAVAEGAERNASVFSSAAAAGSVLTAAGVAALKLRRRQRRKHSRSARGRLVVLAAASSSETTAETIVEEARTKSKSKASKKSETNPFALAFPAFEVGEDLREDSVWHGEQDERPPPIPDTDIRDRTRAFTIVTTASLPWRTGTAVNPTLRAASLARSGREVTLVLPWVGDLEVQEQLFPPGLRFSCREEQAAYVRRWLAEDAGFTAEVVEQLPLRITWYDARFVKEMGAIFPNSRGWTRDTFKDCGFDVLILEEPEHLTWYYHGEHWPSLFRHVVGVIHTNYLDYVVDKKGTGAGWLLFLLSNLVCSSYVDVNIKLSDVIMDVPNQVVCNCHGVREKFLQIGDHHTGREKTQTGATCYYLGKAVWQKGYKNLLDLLVAKPQQDGLSGLWDMSVWQLRRSLSGEGCFAPLPSGECIVEAEIPRIDCFGSGLDERAIREVATAYGLSSEDEDEAMRKAMRFFPGIDHADPALAGYTTFVNPSTSDVLCTATAEALAMGKRVVVARHPSNQFFEENFPDRVVMFEEGDAAGFIRAVQQAEAAGPLPRLSAEQRHLLTWDAANERLFGAAAARVVRPGLRFLRTPSLWPKLVGQAPSRARDERDAEEASAALRPSSAPQARLSYLFHHSLGYEPVGDVLRTLTGATPEVQWEDRRLLQGLLRAWDKLRLAKRSLQPGSQQTVEDSSPSSTVAPEQSDAADDEEAALSLSEAWESFRGNLRRWQQKLSDTIGVRRRTD